MSVASSVNRPIGMPLPNMGPIEAGLWSAAAQDRLDVQRCLSCESHRNPPSPGCIHCGSLEWEWSTLPGTGTIMTFVWIPDPARKEGDYPSPVYNIAVVELDGARGTPVRIVTNIIDAWQIGDISIGQRVELSCVKLTDEIGLPCFKRIAEEAGQ